MSVNKRKWMSTILDIESEKPDPGLAAFAQHKKALLDNLRQVHGSSSKLEPFNEEQSWRALIRTAQWYLRRPKIKQKTIFPARRAERLRDLAKALGRAGHMAQKAMQDDVGMDLFRGWCAEANVSPAVSHVLDDDGSSALTRIAEEIERTVESLATLEAAASRGARGVRRTAGAPRGTGILSLGDINALAEVYRRNTGQKPNLVAGPFAQFVDEFLTAVGQGQNTTQDYVVEVFKYARKQMRKNPGR